MALFEITADKLSKIDRTTFEVSGFHERGDLQRLLKKDIECVVPDVLVIAEEFGEWEESRRRIDLLALDRSANLVVIELKRTEDGGHMELQAIRYAAMVAEMTFETAVETYRKYLAANNIQEDAQSSILDFLGWSEPDETRFAQDTRIVLISSDFSKELTTAVMWLTVKKGLDIRCVRLVPYADNGRTLIDIQQIIPLPEANDYQIKIRRKEQRENQERVTNVALLRFWQKLLDDSEGRLALHSRMSAADHSYIGASTGVRGITLYYVANREDQRVEVYIDRGEAEVNKRIFAQFQERKEEIERAFGGELSWEGLFGKRACRIAFRLPYIGNRNDEADWPKIHQALVEAMSRFEPAITPIIKEIDVR
jgi:hypothetical protein